jgi:hypothetical protein
MISTKTIGGNVMQFRGRDGVQLGPQTCQLKINRIFGINRRSPGLLTVGLRRSGYAIAVALPTS